MNVPDDEQLLARLRDLSLVEPDVLLAGARGDRYAQLLRAYTDDLTDALRAAQKYAHALIAAVNSGPDPLVVLDTSAGVRVRHDARSAGKRIAQRLTRRAESCRELARIDDLVAQLIVRLFEAERRQAIAETETG